MALPKSTPSRRSTVVLVLLSALVASACSLQKFGYQLGLPGTPLTLEVESVVERGAYLDAKIKGKDFDLEVYAPMSEECRAVLVEGGEVRYVEWGLRGHYKAGDYTCDGVGIGEPQIRLARKPRASGAHGTIPRDQATWVEIYRDEDERMLRGRFGAAALIGWNGWADTIAVIPRGEPCDILPVEGATSMEYRAAGQNRLSLVTSGGLCRIVGLIMPEGAPVIPEPAEGGEMAGGA